MPEIKEGCPQALCREVRQMPCIALHGYRFVSDLSLICNEKGIDTVALITDLKELQPMGWPPIVLLHRIPHCQEGLFDGGSCNDTSRFWVGPSGLEERCDQDAHLKIMKAAIAQASEVFMAHG